MDVRCELIDYEDKMNAYDNPRVIVTDVFADGDMVCLHIGDEISGHTVKVVGKELIEAVKRCMRCNYPYI